MSMMKLLFAKSNWEVPTLGLQDFLARTAAAGFDATEIHIPTCPGPPEDISSRHADMGLELVAQITTTGDTPAEHRKSLIAQFPPRLSNTAFVYQLPYRP